MSLRPFLFNYRLTLAVFCGLFVVYFLVAAGRVGGIDASLMLQVTRSILSGTVALPDGSWLQGVDQHQYSHFGLLTSLWWIPFVLLGRLVAEILPQFGQERWEEFFVSFSAIFPALALLAYLRWAWLKQGLEEKRIAIGLLLVGLCTMVFAYAKQLSSDSLMALALFAGWVHCRYGDRRWSCLWAGLWLGLALLARKQAQIIVPILALGMLVHLHSAKRLPEAIKLFIGGTPPVLLMLWYNWRRWGNPFADGYPPFDIERPGSLLEWIAGFYRVLAGEYQGFFLFNLPLLALLIFAIRPWFKRDRVEASTMLLVFVSQLIFFTSMGSRLGPISFGARLMLLCVPLLALAWAHRPQQSPQWTQAIFALTCVFGFVVQLLGVAIDPLAAWQRRLAEGNLTQPILTAHAKELGRVTGFTSATPPVPGQEGLSIYHHPAFQNPDFWWCHILNRKKQPSEQP